MFMEILLMRQCYTASVDKQQSWYKNIRYEAEGDLQWYDAPLRNTQQKMLSVLP
jgi:hypothetical protein